MLKLTRLKYLILFVCTATPFLFGLMKSDSIVYSTDAVDFHFNKQQSYQFQAAKLGNADAAFGLFQQGVQANTYLYKAARLGHPRAAYLYAKHLISIGDSNGAATWKKRAVSLGSADAWLDKMANDILYRDWSSVQSGLTKLDLELAENGRPLTEAQQKKLVSIKRTLLWQDTFDDSNRADEHGQLSSNLTAHNQNHRSDFDKSCMLTIASVVASDAQKDKLTTLIQEFHQLIPQSRSTYCFAPIIVDLQVMAICQPDSLQRANCQQPALRSLLSQYKIANVSHGIALADIGRENTRGNVIHLNDQSSVEVLIHEVGHWIGLVDEYNIREDQKSLYCHSSGVQKLGQNLVIAPSTWSKEQASSIAKQKGFLLNDQDLFQVKTCTGTLVQAYKKYQKTSPMEYLDVTPDAGFLEYYINPIIDNEIALFSD